ncbi:LuxR family transcriptional regulator [Lichenibacterium minor]|uniref:LuxR family transcriptional regulator n=1 Tax=Lichenibacterium minor TaxID=2316528 RepID=A0A4Q2UDI3_9HYPH|nr:helix-turn-helix transcriptional regulator [Lichenibacterium minor]RYC33361.1 LuxR family transcriptional regulator [Lichenibacterium minor]
MRCTPSDAIAAIYACATEPARWPDALQRIADVFGDVGALLIHRREDGGLATVVSPALRHCVELYETVWWRHDIRAARAMQHHYAAAAGAALTDRHCVTDEEVLTHPIYTDFLAPLGLRWTASVEVSPTAGTQVGLSVFREIAGDPYTDDELHAVADLGRHAEQALRLGLRIVEAEAVSLGLGDALARLASGVFVVDASHRVVFCNGRARQLAGTIFAIRDGRLTCRSPIQGDRFHALLDAAGRPGRATSPMVVEGGADRSAVYVFPFDGAASGLAAAGPHAVVLALDLAQGAPLDPGLVRDVYGLTLGEARVAALVGAGVTPREAAAKLDLAEETVRSVLKRVFSKLDVSRQAELTQLFTRLKSVDATS